MIVKIARYYPYFEKQYEPEEELKINAQSGQINLRVIVNNIPHERKVSADKVKIREFIQECQMFEQLRCKYENPLWKNMYLKGKY
jgi:hypothetical protein